MRQAIEAKALNCLSYVDANGDGTATYPFNPNGADLNCAGLTDPTGQVFGLMPHPEAFLSAYNHPDWARRRRAGWPGEEGEGLKIFQNIVAHIRQPHPPAPSPAGEGEPDDFSLVEEGRPHYERRQRRAAGLQTSIDQDVFTAASGSKWQVLKQYGREMRKAPTPAEDALWQAVRGQKLGVAFRRQHAIAGYIVDFVALTDKLIVELDGGIHDAPDQADYDQGRTQLLEEHGYQVIRFSNQEVLHSLTIVLQKIQQKLTDQSL